MIKITKTVLINATADKVYDYLIDPYNLPEYWPNIVKISDVKALPNGGYSNRWVYRMAGLRFRGTGETIECVPGQRIVDRIAGGIDSLQTWTLQLEDGKTRATFEVEYGLRIPVVGKALDVFLVKTNERDGDVVMQKLKVAIESRT